MQVRALGSGAPPWGARLEIALLDQNTAPLLRPHFCPEIWLWFYRRPFRNCCWHSGLREECFCTFSGAKTLSVRCGHCGPAMSSHLAQPDAAVSPAALVCLTLSSFTYLLTHVSLKHPHPTPKKTTQLHHNPLENFQTRRVFFCSRPVPAQADSLKHL